MKKILFTLLFFILSTKAYGTTTSIKSLVTYPDVRFANQLSSPSTFDIVIDAASEKVAFIIQAPKTGAVRKVGFKIGSSVTTGATLDIRLESVAATGFPSGSLFGAGTSATQVVTTSDAAKWFTVTLGSDANVTVGDYLAIVVSNPSSSFGNMRIAYNEENNPILPEEVQFPLAVFNVNGLGWLSLGATPITYIEYSDGSSLPFGGTPFNTYGEISLDIDTDPDEVGNIFQISVPARVAGFWVSYGDTQDSLDDHDVILYDSDGTTVLLSFSIDVDLGNNGDSTWYGFFDSNYTLTKDTNYRIVVKPTAAAANPVLLRYVSVDSTAILGAYDGGTTIQKTQRTNGGSWLQTSTDRVSIGVIIDAFDDGTGGAAAATTAYTWVS